MTFGKQRVQYRTFDWQYIAQDPFEVHFYQGGRDLAEFGIRSLAFDLARYEFIVNGDLSEAAVNDIVDTVFCPLVHAAADGVTGDLVRRRFGR